MTVDGSGGTAGRSAVLVMNPRSGGGRVRRFDLVAQAERLGARVSLTSSGQSAGELARLAADGGASLLGVAGGDGTVAAVAAVAADRHLPLVVIPAGTRNHFARDLGLDITNPARALTALTHAQPVRVDLGMAGSHVFVNNVSFGFYAEALLEPGYRQAKARAFAAVAPGYLEGQQWVPASVAAPTETIDRPQVVLVSNNPYHLATLHALGRRFALDTGALGVVVVKRPADPPPAPDLLARMRHELRVQGSTGSPSAGVLTWSAPAVELRGDADQLPAGIDGEATTLPLPLRCTIRPGALQVLLPAAVP